jgi:MFS family permease
MVILAMSLALLVAIGYGEAYKSYSLLKIESVKALSEIVKKSVEGFVNAGLPLKEYIGFSPLAKPIAESDSAIVELSLVSQEKEVLFSTRVAEESADDAAAVFTPSHLGKKRDPYKIEESGALFKVLIPLRSKFETEPVGYLQVLLKKSAISGFVRLQFLPVLFAAPIIFFLFYLFIAKVAKGRLRKTIWINLAYSVAFFAMAVVVIFVLVGIYTHGIQGKTSALAQSLSQRLDTAFDLRLELKDFSEMDLTFAEYRELNPEISYIELIREGQIVIHTDKTRLNESAVADTRFFHHAANLKSDDGNAVVGLEVGVGILKKLVYQKIARSVKNFMVLFIASGFLAFLFLSLVTSINREYELKGDTRLPVAERTGALEVLGREIKLTMIRPVYFLGVFIEGMSASFLPQFFQGISGIKSMGVDLAVSVLFTAFFIAYGAALIPGGKYARKNGIKKLITWSIVFNAAAIFAMAFVSSYGAMLFLRILVGLGQGLLLIGVQYFILEVVHKSNETQGNSIVVVEYCGGRLAGAAIGGLLATYIGFSGVFLCGGLLGLLTLLYIRFVIPDVSCVEAQEEEVGPEFKGFGKKLRAMVNDPDFSLTTMFVGIHSKLVTTGVVIFALPLLMAGKNFLQEDIGQVLMFYSGGLLLSSNYLARYVDRTKRTRGILLLGNIGSGLGLLLIGAMGSKLIMGASLSLLPTIVLIAGTLTLGVFHGFINAPIITHITGTKVSKVLGRSATASFYRTIERVGQIFGPFVMSQFLIFYNQGTGAFVLMGLITIGLGIAYMATFKTGAARPQPAKA